MHLLLCIGNTNTKAYLQKSRPVLLASFPTRTENYSRLVMAFAKSCPGNLQSVGVVSVVPRADAVWTLACKKANLPPPVFFNASKAARAGIRINYRPVKSLGSDRICAALGGVSMYPKRDRIIVDAGTAVTVDAITKNDAFQGGFIFPGPDLALAALSSGTALLPRMNPTKGYQSVGRTTKECMNQGVLNQCRGGVRECIRFLQRELRLSEPIVLYTGGAAELLRPVQKENETRFAPDLVLKGLQYWMQAIA